MEFRQRVEELQKEHKRFVAKALQLDPTPMWKPGERHAYVSKKLFEEAVRNTMMANNLYREERRME